MFLPAVQQVREAARRISCQNNIRQHGIAIQSYLSIFDAMPGNGGYVEGAEGNIIDSSNGQPTEISTLDHLSGQFYRWGIGNPLGGSKTQSGSWAYSILPHIEQSAAHQEVLVESKQPMFLCASRARPNSLPTVDDSNGNYVSGGLAWAKTDYAANARLCRDLPEVPLKVANLSDGLSNTWLMAEKAYDYNAQTATSWYWDEPIFSGGSKGTVRAGVVITQDGYGIPFRENWGSAHPGTISVGHADGSVHSIDANIEFEIVRALLTYNGGEVEANELF